MEIRLELIAALAVVGAAFALVLAVKFKAAMLAYGLMLFAGSLSPPTDWEGRFVNTWLMPIQMRRSEIVLGAGVLLGLSLLMHSKRIRWERMAGQAVFMLVIALYAAFVRMVASQNPQEGVKTLFFALGTLVPAIAVLPSLFEDKEDVMNFLRVVALVSAGWALACAVQFVVRRQVLVLGGGFARFNGMLSNPQHAGAYLAFMTTTCIFLLLNETKQRYRIIWAGLSALNGIMLLWTGSRTGTAMCGMATMMVLYTRLGRAVLFLPIALGAFVLLFSIVGDQMGDALQRFGGGGDTRSVAWDRLSEQFSDNPMFGTGAAEDTASSENSLLLGLASYGILMGLIIGLFMLFSAYQMLRLFALRFRLDPLERRMADYVIGVNAAYFAGSMFEGYIVSRVSSPMIFMLGFAAVGAWLMNRAHEARHHDEHHQSGEPPALDDSSAMYAQYADYGSEPGSSPPSDPADSSSR